jgi:hypothetical protein
MMDVGNYRVLYACVWCEKAVRRRYPDAKITRLDNQEDRQIF